MLTLGRVRAFYIFVAVPEYNIWGHTDLGIGQVCTSVLWHRFPSHFVFAGQNINPHGLEVVPTPKLGGAIPARRNGTSAVFSAFNDKNMLDEGMMRKEIEDCDWFVDSLQLTIPQSDPLPDSFGSESPVNVMFFKHYCALLTYSPRYSLHQRFLFLPRNWVSDELFNYQLCIFQVKRIDRS
eukprot:Trichotokara_eunicae@DN8030_c0_g1_i1.p1